MRDGTPPPPRPHRVYKGQAGWIAGVAALVVLAYILVNTLRTDAPGQEGLKPGRPLPAFAVPLALSDLDGDANVATQPNQGGNGKRPACEVRGPKIMNICQLAERGPVVLAFLATRSGRCPKQLDALQRVASSFPGVQIAGLAIRGDRGDLRTMIRSHGWTFPVGYDHDGLVSNVYGVAGCPEMTIAYPGGIVKTTTFGLIAGARLRATLRRLVAESKAKYNWTPPAS